MLLNDEKVTNGNFITWTVPGTPTGWVVTGESGNDPEVDEAATGESHANTPTLGGGMCNIYTSDGTEIRISQSVTFVVGRKYQVSVIVDTETTGSIRVFGNWTAKNPTGVGTHTWTFVATTTSPTVGIGRYGGNPCDVTVDNFSIKEDIPTELSRTGQRVSSFPEN